MQAKLLRVLQEGEIRPVGSNRVRRIDVRIIAASNVDLAARVEDGRFRVDLYHRLHVFPVSVPPLRERHGDVRILAERFFRVLAEQEAREHLRLQDETIAALECYPWPGNVRELRNEIHSLVLNAPPESEIPPSALPPRLQPRADTTPSDRPLKDMVRDVEITLIHDRLRAHGYRRAATAASLGLTREGLWQKLRALGMQLPKR